MMNKWQRHRKKCIDEGRCPHCGKPCAPYSECANRRFYKKVIYTLQRMLICGQVKTENNKFAIFDRGKPLKKIRCIEYKINENDIRKNPRIGKTYIVMNELIGNLLNNVSEELTEEEINIKATRLISKLKKEYRERRNGR